ncbi:pre-mRNA-splicing factor syf2 [Lobulomyces angularis]|nr:pre-mRNA-splicing factor syf2 [Lobulomyces angularis]
MTTLVPTSVTKASKATKISNKPNSFEERFSILKKKRLDSLTENRNDVKADLHKSVVLNKKNEQKLKKFEDLTQKMSAEEKGLDYERIKALDYSAEDFEKWEEKQAEKRKVADVGFSDYAQAAAKKYVKLSKEIKPDLELYEKQKEFDQIFKVDKLSQSQDNKPHQASIDKMAKDINNQIEKREKLSKRRPHNEEDDVTYINNRNKHFNKKISRAFDKYTKDIKDSFERGTALD